MEFFQTVGCGQCNATLRSSLCWQKQENLYMIMM